VFRQAGLELIAAVRAGLVSLHAAEEIAALPLPVQKEIVEEQQNEALASQNVAAEIKVRAERRVGELLGEMVKNPGGRPAGETPSIVEGVSDAPPTYEDLGISYTTAFRWQLLSPPPEEEFDRYIDQTKEQDEELTTAGVLSFAKAYKPPPAGPKRPGQGVSPATAGPRRTRRWPSPPSWPPWPPARSARPSPAPRDGGSREALKPQRD
jgi:hypothetical protein